MTFRRKRPDHVSAADAKRAFDAFAPLDRPAVMPAKKKRPKFKEDELPEELRERTKRLLEDEC